MSDNNIKKKLDEEIERQIDDLSGFDAGSDEKTTAINELVKLHNLRIEEMKMELEFTDRTEKREMEKTKNEFDFEDRTEKMELEKSKHQFEVEDRTAKMELEKSKHQFEVEDRTAKMELEKSKHQFEVEDRTEKREMDLDIHDKEMEFKERQFKEDCKVHERTGCNDEKKLSEQKKDRYFNLGIKALEISLPLVFYAVWMKAGFKFEQEGVFTSTTFKELFKNFRPKK